ncbi:F0F1 ATP synthase subunit A [Luteococcus sp. Sow4_B9]|uniref:F0F1 ATP synthase subunit A n=1 Tax=Luteococcus sp. Sow4_B9 TaxID=3438792 RepID=UPI003F97ECF9
MNLVPMEGGGWVTPGVKDFQFDGNYGIDWLTKPAIQAILAAIIVIAFWLWASSGLKVKPTKKQVVMERAYEFVRNAIARDTLGRDYRKFLPYLLALFSFILINNWFGELFFSMFPTFSNIGYAYGLAIVTFFVYVGAGFAKHGVGGYLKHTLMPPGVPWWIMPLIIPLEFLSNFITRPLTLSMRLFANLFAGHLVIMLFVVGGAFLLTYPDNLFFNVSGALSLIFSFALLGLELFIGALQAYVFTVLTAQYVSSSIADEH